MADGAFDYLGKADPMTAAKDEWPTGRTFEVDGNTFRVGDKVWHFNSKELLDVVGGLAPAKWDKHKEKYVACSAQQAELDLFLWVTLRTANGKTFSESADNIGTEIECDDDFRPPMDFLSYDEMVAIPEPDMLVEGLLQCGTSALMFGKSNAYKSFIGIDVACSVATLDNWHGHKIAKRGHVLYVATEGSMGVAKQRIPGWMASHGIEPADRNRIMLHREEIAIDDQGAIDRLIESCANYAARRRMQAGEAVYWGQENNPKGSFDLIVVDIFGASMNGPETSDETARAWVRNVNRIMREVGCTGHFDRMVKEGVLPSPRDLLGVKVWLRQELDDALFALVCIGDEGGGNTCDSAFGM